MNATGMRPAPAPCNEPAPLAFRPRVVASVRSIRFRVDPVSRTKDNGFDPLRRAGMKIIPLRHSKANVDVLPGPTKLAVPAKSDGCARQAAGNVASAISVTPSLATVREQVRISKLRIETPKAACIRQRSVYQEAGLRPALP